ncbi:hypothetical protein XELAEV_18028987mg [Xenopus laevis]|uniref:Uncharacterized protein n=1 Tax=Xenopus laevis TaxID=8355 RepID=A0A974CQS3_XENLA|nr:hypothetical protein XELAEV_18028987mg [Xenopus laevis]
MQLLCCGVIVRCCIWSIGLLLGSTSGVGQLNGLFFPKTVEGLVCSQFNSSCLASVHVFLLMAFSTVLILYYKDDLE